MSRSVRQDYEALRKPQYLYVQESGTVRYIGATIPFTDEQYFGSLGGAYERKGIEHLVAPTNEDWAKYHLAKRALLTLQAYENVLGLDEVEVRMPKPEYHFSYTEPNEAWLERCRALQAERKAA